MHTMRPIIVVNVVSREFLCNSGELIRSVCRGEFAGKSHGNSDGISLQDSKKAQLSQRNRTTAMSADILSNVA